MKSQIPTICLARYFGPDGADDIDWHPGRDRCTKAAASRASREHGDRVLAQRALPLALAASRLRTNPRRPLVYTDECESRLHAFSFPPIAETTLPVTHACRIDSVLSTGDYSSRTPQRVHPIHGD
jgi:hypothetical protein